MTMRFAFISSIFMFFYPITVFSQSADIIFSNGKIFTSDTSKLYVQALAVKGNRILATGTNSDILKFAGNRTNMIDLDGKTVVPGFNDAHDHLGWLSPVGISFTYPEIPSGPDKNAVIDSVLVLVKKAKPGQWISGWIGTNVLFDTSMRNTLDSIASDKPIVLQAWWGHGLLISAKALELSGLSDDTKDLIGGRYIREPVTGKINSILENAQIPVWNAWFGSDSANQVKGLRSFSQKQIEAGITTVQQMSSPFNAQQSMFFFNSANLSQRIRVIGWPRTTPEGRLKNEWNKVHFETTSLTYFSGIKYMIDGTPIEQLALFKKPYVEKKNWYGELDYPVDTIRSILKEALNSDQQLIMHIVGDSTMAIVLNEMEKMAEAGLWKAKRVRFEHNSTTSSISEKEIKALKNLGILVMHTPKYNQKNLLNSLLKEGILIGVAPDITTNPFEDISYMTIHQFSANENISREQAVIAYTLTNSYAEFKDKEKGTLTPGMLADLVVLSHDVFTVPDNQLPFIKSLLTMIDGKIIYEAKNTDE